MKNDSHNVSMKKKLLKSFAEYIKNEVGYFEYKSICADTVLEVLSKEVKISDKEKKKFLVDCELMG